MASFDCDRLQFPVFFLYDHSTSLSEEDDPKNAILYFYPPNISDTVQCIWIGQLMGISKFFQTCFNSSPYLIKLQNEKFALKKCGSYTLALGNNLSQTDASLTQQLERLHELINFFHGSIELLHKHTNKFQGPGVTLQEGSFPEVCERYLMYISYCQEKLIIPFSVIPNLELPLFGSPFYLKSLHLLQACQRRPGVMGGCLFYNNRIICSQLSTNLTTKLLFLLPSNQKWFGIMSDPVTIDFRLPTGVFMFPVYLESMEYLELQKFSHNSLKQRHTKSSNFLIPMQRAESDHKTFNINIPQISESPLDPGIAVTSSLNSLSLSDNSENKPSTSVNSGEGQLTKGALSPKSSNNLKPTDRRRKSSVFQRPQESTELTLYMHTLSDMVLILLLDPEFSNKADLIHVLWKAGMSTLESLEKDIKKCPNAEEEVTIPNFRHICYDTFTHTLKGEPSHISTLEEFPFSEDVQIIHEDFKKYPALSSISFRSFEHATSGRHSPTHEIFLQPMEKSYFYSGFLCDDYSPLLEKIKQMSS